MKITFEKSDLLHALNLVNGACGGSDTLSILSCVMICGEAGVVEITGNDLEIAVKVETPAIIEKDGMIAVPAKRLLELVKELPTDKPIDFEAYGNKNKDGTIIINKLKITCGVDTYHMVGLNADDYPERVEVEGKTFTIACSELQNVLRQTEFAASKEGFRYQLNAIFFNQHEAVATNMNILARVACPVQTPKFIIPLQAAKELQKTLKHLDSDIAVTVGNNLISFVSNHVTLTSRLITGEYLLYWEIIPKKYWLTTPILEEEIELLTHEYSVTVSKSDFTEALKRVSVFACDKTFLVILEIESGKIHLSCEDDEGSSTEWVACSGSGSVRIGLNARALLEILFRVDGESLVIEFGDAETAILFKSSDTDDFISVMGPMSLE